MKNLLKILCCVVGWGFVQTGLMAQEAAVNPTRPSVADNGYLTTTGFVEIEFGWSRVPSAWSFPTLLKAGVDSSLEIGLTSTGILSKPAGSSATSGTPGAQLKWQALSDSWGALSLVAHFDWPSNGPPLSTFYPVVSIKSDHVLVDLAVGGSFAKPFASDRQSSYFYALAVAPDLRSNLTVYGEVYGTLSDGRPVHAADLGVLYALSSLLVLDFAIGTGITSNADDWTFQLGFTASLFRMF